MISRPVRKCYQDPYGYGPGAQLVVTVRGVETLACCKWSWAAVQIAKMSQLFPLFAMAAISRDSEISSYVIPGCAVARRYIAVHSCVLMLASGLTILELIFFSPHIHVNDFSIHLLF